MKLASGITENSHEWIFIDQYSGPGKEVGQVCVQDNNWGTNNL